ncbi:MAG: hypothetical protein ACTHLZ_03595 [Tepidisphaeraceae bacterium]
MSDAALPNTAAAYDTGHEDHEHSPHLAHHFDTMEQQYDSGKLGMWVFLATELLMFGGLFCAYSVYRANHPEVFLYAHTYLSTMWGAINTAILLTSSLTMAWAVRCSQLNQNRGLFVLLLVTLMGGAGFMMIKAVEYNHKFHEDLAPGRYNQYNVDYKGNKEFPGMNNSAGVKKLDEELKAEAPPELKPAGIAATPAEPYLYFDPNATSPDAAKIIPHFTAAKALATSETYGIPHAGHELKSETTSENAGESMGSGEGESHAISFVDMTSQLDRQRVNTFFGIYYCMTGLHGVHVLVGMGLIFWIAYRAGTTKQKAWIPPLPILTAGAYMVFLWAISSHTGFLWVAAPLLAIGAIWLVIRVAGAARVTANEPGEFSEHYFAPVDLVGLYWHLVDLIWIFLFPLLYLIHGKVGS